MQYAGIFSRRDSDYLDLSLPKKIADGHNGRDTGNEDDQKGYIVGLMKGYGSKIHQKPGKTDHRHIADDVPFPRFLHPRSIQCRIRGTFFQRRRLSHFPPGLEME
jgi:hypothetical protein